MDKFKWDDKKTLQTDQDLIAKYSIKISDQGYTCARMFLTDATLFHKVEKN